MRVKRLVVGDLDANCYIISLEDGACIIIDPGADSDLIVRSIEDDELEPISIVLTHSHYDHISAALAIRERYGIPILIHDNRGILIHFTAQGLNVAERNVRN
jgi:glyoxylase-like metal-dependent hydrolase (beta-lactamase superfamily II)